MYNAALRPSAPRYSPRLSSSQLKDLLCTTQRTPQLGSGHLNDSQRDFAYCDAPQFNATICLSIYYRTAALRSAPLCIVSLLGSSPCVAPQHIATLLNDLFVTTPLHAARLLTPHHGSPPLTAPQFNSTICLFLFASRHGATQRFVYYFAPLQSAALRNSTRLSAALLSAARLNSTICLSIYYRTALLRSARHLSVALRNATQRFVCQFILRNSAPHNETQQTAA